jgi:hypothetical protein
MKMLHDRQHAVNGTSKVECGAADESNHGNMMLSLVKAAEGDRQRWLEADVMVGGIFAGQTNMRRLDTIRTRKEYGRRMT